MMNNRLFDAVEKNLSKLDNLAVAFSGGIDSAILLYVGKKALGENIVAYTYATPYLPVSDYQDSIDFTKNHSIEHIIIEERILPSLLSNPIDRCYLCKKNMFSSIIENANNRGIDTVADATLADDPLTFRPGVKALHELGIYSPFQLQNISKNDIRNYARSEKIPLWNKPSNSCYLTRLPFNQPITKKKIRMIQEAESILSSFGYDNVRVRYNDEIARIELPYDEWKKFASSKSYEKVVSLLTNIGFLSVYAIPKELSNWQKEL